MSATDIAGYTFRAENYTPANLIPAVIAAGFVTRTYGENVTDVEAMLDEAAVSRGIDRYDERSFDSGDFPKVIFESQITEDDNDWYGRD